MAVECLCGLDVGAEQQPHPAPTERGDRLGQRLGRAPVVDADAGPSIDQEPCQRDAAPREAGIETVFQTLALADDLDVPDNLFLGREKTFANWLGPFRILDYKSMRQATIDGLNKTAVKIPNIRNTIRNISGGQRQCVAIARTATFHSRLTIMDEPTAGLDPNQIRQFRDNIKQLGSAKTILISTHILQEVDAIADYVLFVHNGRLVFEGTPAQLQEGGSLEQPFYRLTSGAVPAEVSAS